MIVLDQILIVQQIQSPLASIPQQIGPDECLDEAQQIIEVLWGVDIIEWGDD